MQPSSLGGLLQKAPFWCCFPSPSMQPAGAERLRPVGGWGGNTDALQSSACLPGDQLLQLLSRQHGRDEHAAGAAREVARGVQGKEPESKSCSAGQRSCFARQVGDRDGAPSWPAPVEEILCRDVVALAAGQGSSFLTE